MPITGTIQRGSVVWLNLFPKKGHEQTGWRSAIVLSDGLIDPNSSDLAMIVPITTVVKGYPFEVEVPSGIATPSDRVEFSELCGVVLTDHVKSVDLSARDAVVIGQVDPDSQFYRKVVSYVRSILA